MAVQEKACCGFNFKLHEHWGFMQSSKIWWNSDDLAAIINASATLMPRGCER